METDWEEKYQQNWIVRPSAYIYRAPLTTWAYYNIGEIEKVNQLEENLLTNI